MCLILFSFKQHPRYKLILVANRDEFYARKTAPADYWPNQPNILGGRDLEAVRDDGTYGTWMAISKSGKIAMVTNYRDFQNLKTIAPSRGHLVSDYLIEDKSATDYLNEIEPKKNNYNGFNLIIGTPDSLYYLSNYKDGIHTVDNGVHGLSNSLLDTPWPKVISAKEKLNKILMSALIDTDELLDMMQDETLANESKLPNTGIGVEREKALSSMFIKTNGYGTRCSTALLISNENEITFVERTYDLTNFSYTNKKFEFKVD